MAFATQQKLPKRGFYGAGGSMGQARPAGEAGWSSQGTPYAAQRQPTNRGFSSSAAGSRQAAAPYSAYAQPATARPTAQQPGVQQYRSPMQSRNAAEMIEWNNNNPPGSPGFNAFYNSQEGQILRLQAAGKQPYGLTYIASDPLNKAMDEYWDARGREDEYGRALPEAAFRQRMYQAQNERLRNGGSQEDFIRELRDATQKIRQDNDVSRRRDEKAEKNWQGAMVDRYNRMMEWQAKLRTPGFSQTDEYKAAMKNPNSAAYIDGRYTRRPEEMTEDDLRFRVELANDRSSRQLAQSRMAWGESLYAPSEDKTYADKIQRWRDYTAGLRAYV